MTNFMKMLLLTLRGFIVFEGVLNGRWPGHRVTMSLGKLCPVHRSFIAMSGRGLRPDRNRIRIEPCRTV